MTNPLICPYCERGRIKRVNPPGDFECTSCNGTGIAGDPGCLVWIGCACIALWIFVGYLVGRFFDWWR